MDISKHGKADVSAFEATGPDPNASIHDQDESSHVISAIDPDAERRLVRKFDYRILPVLAIMYLFNSLDKSNLGNAKTAPDDDGGSRGLPYDLNFASNQYSQILSIFFVPYVLTAPVLGIIGKKYGPNRVLPTMMFAFGGLTLLMVSAYNFSGVFALRWFLGMSESAFFPLVIYYQTTFYRRGELARRLAIFYAAQSIAGRSFHLSLSRPSRDLDSNVLGSEPQTH